VTEEIIMTSGIGTIIIPVTDLEAAKAVYGQLLGVAPVMDAPYYVQFQAGDQAVGLDPNGHKKGMTGPLTYWHVEDLAGRIEALLKAGAEQLQPAQDVGGGKLIASVKDADGNVIGLLQEGA
jgi:predicted enzyme related to lactoylglutathione lyase